VGDHVLIVEDDPAYIEVLGLILKRAGFAPECVADGAKALATFESRAFALVIVDLMLPNVDGFQVCRLIRERSLVPIIMLTGRSELGSIVRGLEGGADEYITKPVEAAELLARIRALLRRTNQHQQAETIDLGNLRIDTAARTVTRNGHEISLSATEFRLLLELAANASRALSRQMLLERVWQAHYLGDSRLVDMAVKRLRDKVEEEPAQPKLISTVRGFGYRLDPPDND